jgi:hypothetical protein
LRNDAIEQVSVARVEQSVMLSYCSIFILKSGEAET